MKYRARLDGDGIYQGVEAVSELSTGDVEVPGDCDLAAGRYWWDGEKFEPLAKRGAADRNPPPESIEAIALGFVSLWKSGSPLHDATHEWLGAYFTGVDMLESIDGGKHKFRNDALVVEYMTARGLTKGQQ
jgi:hypothetical protein